MRNFDREIPGTIQTEYREYRYVADDGNDNFFDIFCKITEFSKPIATHGGVITENCKLWLPNNQLFHALSYKGDIQGWRQQIEQRATYLGLITGKVKNHFIYLSDDTKYALSDCVIEFY